MPLANPEVAGLSPPFADQYPLCHTASMKPGRPPRSLAGLELEAISQLILALAEQRGCDFLHTFDFFGAYPLHG